MAKKICSTCNGSEFNFIEGPCPDCNPIILGFAIKIKSAFPDHEKDPNPKIERDALLWGISEAIADSFIEIGESVGKPY